MSTTCPSQTDLLLAALQAPAPPEDASLAGHVASCPDCRASLTGLRQVVHTLRADAPERPADGACLDALELAYLLDEPSFPADRRPIAHLAVCATCRFELRAARRLLEEPVVAAELKRLEGRHPTWRVSRVAFPGALAAAAVAAILLGPGVVRNLGPGPAPQGETYRERTITTTVAPRILGPSGGATMADSLRWTSVPGADLYRVTLWRRDGTVAWQGELRDTAVALPPELVRSGERALLWDVKARTGWDRWVASDLVEILLGDAGR